MFGLFLRAAREDHWIPRVDVYCSSNNWLIKFDLAGVRQEDISVEVQGTRLTVRGFRYDSLVNENWSHYSMEIAYSQFERTVELPCQLEPTDINAEFRNGMLLIYAKPKGQNHE